MKCCYLLCSAKTKQGIKYEDLESGKGSSTKDKNNYRRHTYGDREYSPTPFVTPVPRVPITIVGTVIPAVWASGSQYSYISNSWAKKLFTPTQILPTNKSADAVGVSPFKFIGAVKCTVKLGSIELPHMLLVTPDIFTTEALLGYDFMKKLGDRRIRLSLLKGIMKIDEEVIALCSKDGGPYQSKVSGEAELTSLYSVFSS